MSSWLSVSVHDACRKRTTTPALAAAPNRIRWRTATATAKVEAGLAVARNLH
jgi:hypothetical protein